MPVVETVASVKSEMRDAAQDSKIASIQTELSNLNFSFDRRMLRLERALYALVVALGINGGAVMLYQGSNSDDKRARPGYQEEGVGSPRYDSGAAGEGGYDRGGPSGRSNSAGRAHRSKAPRPNTGRGVTAP